MCKTGKTSLNQLSRGSGKVSCSVSCRWEKYSYYVWNNRVPSAFECNCSYHYPEQLDTDKMNEACKKLVGTHDFIGFSSLKKVKKSTVRTIDEITNHRESNLLHFTFTGEGFLYKMIRIIMGTLLEIGVGTTEPECIDAIL